MPITLPLILASGSPRRRELLGFTGLEFVVKTADIDESVQSGESAQAYTLRLSQEKAEAVAALLTEPHIVLAADTTVADGDAILGKPADANEARTMLRQLRGRAHQVYTAVTLLNMANDQRVTDVAVTDVPMRAYSEAELEAYIASGDPFDKAGGYAIQNTAFHPVTLLTGCFANVVGLPLCHVVRGLRQLGVTLTTDVPGLCQQHHAYTCDVTEDILRV